MAFLTTLCCTLAAIAVAGLIAAALSARTSAQFPGSLAAEGVFETVVDLSDAATRAERERDFHRICANNERLPPAASVRIVTNTVQQLSRAFSRTAPEWQLRVVPFLKKNRCPPQQTRRPRARVSARRRGVQGARRRPARAARGRGFGRLVRGVRKGARGATLARRRDSRPRLARLCARLRHDALRVRHVERTPSVSVSYVMTPTTTPETRDANQRRQFRVPPNFDDPQYVLLRDVDAQALRVMWAAFVSGQADTSASNSRRPFFVCFVSEPLRLHQRPPTEPHVADGDDDGDEGKSPFVARFAYFCERRKTTRRLAVSSAPGKKNDETLGGAIAAWLDRNALTTLPL